MESVFTIEISLDTSNNFLKDKVKADFVLVVNNKKHECHKFIIVSHSNLVFRHLQDDPSINYQALPENIDNDSLDKVIGYIYGNALKINPKNLDSIEFVAQCLEIPTILEITGSYILCKQKLSTISQEMNVSVPPLSESSQNIIAKYFIMFYHFISGATPVNAYFILNNKNLTVPNEDILLHWTITIIMRNDYSIDSMNLLKSIHLENVSENVLAGLKANRANYEQIVHEIEVLLTNGDFSKIPQRKPVVLTTKEMMFEFLSDFTFDPIK